MLFGQIESLGYHAPAVINKKPAEKKSSQNMTQQSLLESIDYKILSYGDDELQRLAVYVHNAAKTVPKKWIVYIHGGAWRDPNNDHHDGDYIISNILKNHPAEYAGASIDYPLSSRVQHPEFALNALKALTKLNKQYEIEEYILVGHSAGAHIALQTFLYGRLQPDTLSLIKKCHKVFGVEGIYILDLLVRENEGYRGFTEEAFGQNIAGSWDTASPFSADPSNQRYHWTTDGDAYRDGSTSVPFVDGTLYICHSPTDELLIEKYQPETTFNILKKTTSPACIGVKYLKISGLHEEAIRNKDIIEAIDENIHA